MVIVIGNREGIRKTTCSSYLKRELAVISGCTDISDIPSVAI